MRLSKLWRILLILMLLNMITIFLPLVVDLEKHIDSQTWINLLKKAPVPFSIVTIILTLLLLTASYIAGRTESETDEFIPMDEEEVESENESVADALEDFIASRQTNHRARPAYEVVEEECSSEETKEVFVSRPASRVIRNQESAGEVEEEEENAGEVKRIIRS